MLNRSHPYNLVTMPAETSLTLSCTEYPADQERREKSASRDRRDRGLPFERGLRPAVAVMSSTTNIATRTRKCLPYNVQWKPGVEIRAGVAQSGNCGERLT